MMQRNMISILPSFKSGIHMELIPIMPMHSKIIKTSMLICQYFDTKIFILLYPKYVKPVMRFCLAQPRSQRFILLRFLFVEFF